MTSIYDMIQEKENEMAILREQVSGLQAEIEALRLAAGILEGRIGAQTAGPVAVRTAAPGDKNRRVWP